MTETNIDITYPNGGIVVSYVSYKHTWAEARDFAAKGYIFDGVVYGGWVYWQTPHWMVERVVFRFNTNDVPFDVRSAILTFPVRRSLHPRALVSKKTHQGQNLTLPSSFATEEIGETSLLVNASKAGTMQTPYFVDVTQFFERSVTFDLILVAEVDVETEPIPSPSSEDVWGVFTYNAQSPPYPAYPTRLILSDVSIGSRGWVSEGFRPTP